MISLVSYPRSGNTFLRNVLHKVYGIESKTFHDEAHGPDEGWEQSPVVKTHLLPHQLPESLRKRPIVYLIRDGRDATVSLAHHRCDVIDPGSDFSQNLREATYAAEGSHFSGWSHHTKTWVRQADIIIRFEDLIREPITQIERLRPYLDLPKPDRDNLPTFEDLKAGKAEYGTGNAIGKDLSQFWFRKGKVNAWKSEMNENQQRLFWHLHGEVMGVFGYAFDGQYRFELPNVSALFQSKCGLTKDIQTAERFLLVEANKLKDEHFDGIKRYVFELLKSAQDFANRRLRVTASIGHEEMSVDQALQQEGLGHESIESGMLYGIKNTLKAVLPGQAYNKLATEFPLAKVQKVLKRKKESNVSQGAMTHDVALLTLPQNFEYLSNAKFRDLAVVVHDLTHKHYPQFHEANNVARTQLGMQFCKDRSAKLIAVSKSTQNDLLEDGLHSNLVYEGVDRGVFYPITNQHLLGLVKERYKLPKQKFLLSVSTLEPRKNIARLIEAFSNLPRQVREEYHLVLAGKKGWKWKEFNVPENCVNQVHFTGFIREDHLPALYTLAHGFCYVSLSEGFGLPVVEAMACCCPVLVSNVSSLPELVGETGVQCNPKSLQEIELGLMKLIEIGSDQSARDQAQERSWQFTWSNCWEGVLGSVQV